MANECSFEMRIKGSYPNINMFLGFITKKLNIREIGWFPRWINIIDIEQEENFALLHGICCWSVATAMRNKTNESDATLKFLSEILNLDIEVYSEEEGCEFQEHYLVRKGKEEIDDCVDWSVLYFDRQEELDKYNQEHGTDYPLYEDIEIGGFESKYWEIS